METTAKIGSPAHRDLFCRFFIDTHIRFDPEHLPWPTLDGTDRARLIGLPFWREAVLTESVTARTVQAAAQQEKDPAMRKALALQAEEEARHSALLRGLTSFYGIHLGEWSPPPLRGKTDWDYLYAGYGECFDSFFAFGLIWIARESGYFPQALVDIFEPVIQEEARHILFFVNWVAYHRAQCSWWQRPFYDLRRATITILQIWDRLKTARGIGKDENNFTMKGHQEIAEDLGARRFLDICLEENDRRFEPYDPRLLRPRFVPGVVLRILPWLPQ